MDILITGATGFIGRQLAVALEGDGHRVTRLTHGLASPGAIYWDPAAGELDPTPLEGVNAIIHLAGENVTGRWTDAKRAAIRDSRVNSTRLLAQTMLRLHPRPAAFLCASATGFYGDRGGDVQTEGSPRGEGFLAGVCGEWEQAAGLAAGGGVRTVNLRFPAVLHPSGGVMAMMLPVFRMYMGGPLGGGRQCMSWVTLEDAIEAVKHLLYSEEIAGPVNICSPQPVSNAEFTCQLARAIRRPVVFRVPKWALRLAVGEMSREVLLASCHAAPKMLTESGFTFRYPDLADAFAAWQRSGLL